MCIDRLFSVIESEARSNNQSLANFRIINLNFKDCFKISPLATTGVNAQDL
jgi:hypothetical protein